MGVEYQSGKVKRFWRWMVVLVAQFCEYTKYHRTAHSKMVKMVNLVVYISP